MSSFLTKKLDKRLKYLIIGKGYQGKTAFYRPLFKKKVALYPLKKKNSGGVQPEFLRGIVKNGWGC